MTQIESERLDRMEEHLKFLKSDNKSQNEKLSNIENAIIGNNYNGNKGLVHLINDIDLRLKSLERKESIIDDNMKQMKWFARGIATLILSFILYYFTNKQN